MDKIRWLGKFQTLIRPPQNIRFSFFFRCLFIILMALKFEACIAFMAYAADSLLYGLGGRMGWAKTPPIEELSGGGSEGAQQEFLFESS